MSTFVQPQRTERSPVRGLAPFRVGIDARLVGYRRGIGNYVHALLAGLARTNDTMEFLLYVQTDADAAALPADPRFIPRVLGRSPFPVWEQVVVPRTALADRVDVLHAPANTGPLWLDRSIALVLTVHDVMYLMPRAVVPATPRLYQRAGRLYRAAVVPGAVRRAAGVITVSHQSRADLGQYLGTAPDAITVVHEAAAGAFRPSSADAIAHLRARYQLTGPVVLALGANDPRKNTARIIEAFGQVRRAGVPATLVLVGVQNDARAMIDRQLRALGLTEDVVVCGFVSEEDLVGLYATAAVFCYPSLFEGFGLPVLEAMACGTPVVASSAGAVGEIAGDAALFVDPQSVEAISGGLRAVLTDPARATDLRRLGVARAALFSWDAVARRTMQVYAAARQGSTPP